MIQVSADNPEKALEAIRKRIESLDEKQVFKIMFIAEEILTNITRHADFSGRKPHITVDMELTQNGTVLIFLDNAKPFNMPDYPEPDTSLGVEQRELGGLGIYLTKKYAETIEYAYENECNILTIRV